MIACAVFLAYGGTLGSWFHTIDDPIHLAASLEGSYASPHFRPLHKFWNLGLWTLFQDSALAWRSASLLLHLGSSLCLLHLLRQLGLRRVSCLVGAVSFAICFAPNEAAAWNSAACGLLSVFFVLVAAGAWTRFLVSEKRRDYALAVAALVLAVCSKEDAVIAGPLLIGLDIVTRGIKGLFSPRRLALYVPFAIVAVLFLLQAYHPDLWSDNEGVGSYQVGWHSVARLVGTAGLLFWPRYIPIDTLPTGMVVGGSALIAVLLGVAWKSSKSRPLIILGLTILLAGILPVLPGPFPAAASSRYGYPCAIGLGILVAAIAENASSWTNPLQRGMVLIPLALWIALSTWSIHSTAQWRYVQPSLRHKSLVESTGEELKQFLASSSVSNLLLIDPGLWNPQDFRRGITVFHRDLNLVCTSLNLEMDTVPERLGLRMEDPKWKLLQREKGSWVPLKDRDKLPLDRWQESSDLQAERGFPPRLPAFHIVATPSQ